MSLNRGGCTTEYHTKKVGLYWHLFKALVLPTFTWDTEIWGGTLKKSHWKVFEKGMKIHMMCHVFFKYPSYFVGRIWRTSYRIIHSQAHCGFSMMVCPPYTPPPLLLLVSEAIHFPTSGHTRIKHLAQINNHVEYIMGSMSLGNP